MLLPLLMGACALCADRNTSGGPLLAEEAAYDVLHYDLALGVDPVGKRIDGVLTMRAKRLAETERVVMDLDPHLTVESIHDGQGAAVEFVHEGGVISIAADGLPAVGNEFVLAVEYGGAPVIATRPPWNGGFTFSSTKSGDPWVATSCQGEGADLWWPCKDHPSDEADSMDLAITVPQPLVVASNGRQGEVVEGEDGRRTYHWHVSTPINNYGVALNIAPYETLDTSYESVAGDTVNVTYWVLPENVEKGKLILPEFVEHLQFLESLYGPYPFRGDKYGIAETPYLGMEHQSIIAYGNDYKPDPWGFDWLHFHEVAHEWWANLVTAKDWNDFWLHEGFASYSEALYVEHLHGPERYLAKMKSMHRLRNQRAIAPTDSKTTTEMYFSSDGGADNDIYYKGAWFLHTLRFTVGDDAFFRTLRRFAYPDPELEKTTDGSACRQATTADLLATAEAQSEMELDWLFQAYLSQPGLPRLTKETQDGVLHLAWELPEGLAFPMPLEIQVGDELRRVPMPDGEARVEVGAATVVVDPHQRVLRARR